MALKEDKVPSEKRMGAERASLFRASLLSAHFIAVSEKDRDIGIELHDRLKQELGKLVFLEKFPDKPVVHRRECRLEVIQRESRHLGVRNTAASLEGIRRHDVVRYAPSPDEACVVLTHHFWEDRVVDRNRDDLGVRVRAKQRSRVFDEPKPIFKPVKDGEVHIHNLRKIGRDPSPLIHILRTVGCREAAAPTSWGR